MRRMHAMDAELLRFRQTLPAPGPHVSWQVRKLVGSVHATLFDAALNVRTLKDRCRIRDNNVSCRFKHELGISIKAYIESLRLEAARRLLETGAFTASEVAQGVGYANLQTFYRAFERRYGCTPGMLRRRAAPSLAAA